MSSLAQSPSIRLRDAIQVPAATEEELVADDRRRGRERILEFVAGENLELLRFLQHQRRTVQAGYVHAVVDADRRSIHRAQSWQALLRIVWLARSGVHARQDGRDVLEKV